ncbi:MAG: hypothetical protein ACI9V1_001597, partial [Spirosomataceae bacterium]
GLSFIINQKNPQSVSIGDFCFLRDCLNLFFKVYSNKLMTSHALSKFSLHAVQLRFYCLDLTQNLPTVILKLHFQNSPLHFA